MNIYFVFKHDFNIAMRNDTIRLVLYFTGEMVCDSCNKTIKRKDNLIRHQKYCKNREGKLICELCGKYTTYRKDNMKRHNLVCIDRLTKNVFDSEELSSHSSGVSAVREVNGDVRVPPSSICNRSGRNATVKLSKNFPCDICNRPHGNMAELVEHRNVHSSIITGMPIALEDDFASVTLTKHAFGGRVSEYDLKSKEPCSDVMGFFQLSADLVKRLIQSLSPSYILQGRMVARARFFQLNDKGERVEETFLFFPSHPQNVMDGDGEEWYGSHSRRIIELLDTVTQNSSNLEFDCIERVYIKLILRDNVDGQGIFTLPPLLNKKRHAIVNVDAPSECFKYALLSVLHYNDVSNQQRNNPNSYREWEGELDFGDLDVSSIKIADVSKIERLNNLKINVHVWEGAKSLTIRYNNRQTIADKSVNILLVRYQGVSHYCGITSLKRLYNHTNANNHVSYFCERCCRCFSSWRNQSQKVKESLEEHYQFCREGRLQVETLPSDNKYSFTNFSAEESPVVVCYSDIESYITPETKKHCPFMIGMYPMWHEHFNGKRENASMRMWSGEKCIQNYLEYLDSFVRELDVTVDELTCQPLLLDPSEQRAFDNATHCPKCSVQFTVDGKHRKVRDHCHITGNYRGPLCHVCNSRLRLKRRILPVVFHNFKGYDGHLICKQAIGEMPGWHLSVIPVTHEKYMSVRARVEVGKNKRGEKRYFSIIFLDSFQFLSSSLAALVGTLDHLPLTEQRMRARHPGISDAILRRKGVFPYSYFDSPSRLLETRLPPIAKFKDDLSGAECSPDDYAHAQRAWSELECKTLRSYLAEYLYLDICELADVFEEFRKVTLREDGLDPVHFVSLPGLSYEACFKRSKETIDLLQDIDMVRLFERGIRGGLTMVNKHMVKARIPELGNNQDGNVHLAYIDENNLYGSSLCRPLPHSEFSWVDEDELKFLANPDNILKLDDDGDYGYLFEVDLEYPRELHTSTADFPLAPESSFVQEDMFSSFMKEYYSKLCADRGCANKYKPYRKLLLTHYDKEYYVCHYSILKFYIGMGMRLVRVRSAIRFRQKRFVEPYIKYNSSKRALARNAFEKDYYKLKNNSFFGKTMEDVRHRIDFRLKATWEDLEKLLSSPLLVDVDIFSESVVGVHIFKHKVLLNKRVYISQAVLDYSKLEMYNLYYNVLRKCPLIRQPDLVGGDTDSLFLALHTDKNVGLGDVFKSLLQYFDSSNYSQDHPLYSAVNKARLGCFKDEAAGKVIEEMILLRPKMYSMKYLGEDAGIKRAKGISRHLVASTSHDTYREAFLSQSETDYQMTILRSHLHTVETVTFRKRGLSAWEDKRCWLEANSSVPHGSHLSGLPPKRRRVFIPPRSGDVS